MRRRFRIAVLGGTFDRLHPGHRALLARAFRSADEVRVGITTAGYLARHPKPLGAAIEPFAIRRSHLVAYLERRYPGRRYRIAPLSDGFGGSVRPGPDLIVVSAATRRGARAVNRERVRRGLDPIAIEVVPWATDRDGRRYSSRRRRRAERRGTPRKTGRA